MTARILASVGLVFWSVGAAAQTPTKHESVTGYLAINGGYSKPVSSSMEIVAQSAPVPSYPGQESLKTTYKVTSRPLFDIGGGLVWKSHYRVGVAFIAHRGSAVSTSVVALDHPQYHPVLTASLDSQPLDRSETDTHFQFGYQFQAGRFEGAAFAGPSHVGLTQELVVDAVVGERSNYNYSNYTVTYSAYLDSVSIEKVKAGGWGYNVGGDASFWLTRVISVGGTVNYARETVSLPNSIQMLIDGRNASAIVDMGGLHLGAGVRFRF